MEYTIALHTRHDANLAFTAGGGAQGYVEFEKVTQRRYFAFAPGADVFEAQCRALILPFLPERSSISRIILNWVLPEQEEILRSLLGNGAQWLRATHHLAHAWSCYAFTKPGPGDVILSYDGGGDLDDTFKIFRHQDGEMTLIKDAPLKMGRPYRLLGLLSPELNDTGRLEGPANASLAGKIMALASMGETVERLREPLRDFYLNYSVRSEAGSLKTLCERIEYPERVEARTRLARAVFATSQAVFEELVLEQLSPCLASLRPPRLLITGGCALNVTANTRISGTFGLPIFVPPCPNDCGISLGTLRMFDPTFRMSRPYTAILPANPGRPDPASRGFGSRAFDLKEVSRLLAEGKVIGTMWGDMEIGPRALGNHSCLANPLIGGMKDKMNRIKGRENWRPVAPIVKRSQIERYFLTGQESPYMSFAPQVRPEYREQLAEIVHFDGSARIQTVDESDGWIFELLSQFEKDTGVGILMNTSFNQKGRPLINSLRGALDIIADTDVDAVVTETEIISKSPKEAEAEVSSSPA